MRFVRAISVSLASLFLIVLGMAPASAVEIPSLTWERGKTLNVVLGGSAENLEWKIYLVGENQEPIAFSRSNGNSSSFYVYTVSLPRELPLGQYQVIARGKTGPATTVAAVEVVERFQYNVLEIPRDLLFLLATFILFVAVQLSVRTWKRKELALAPRVGSESAGLKEALLIQRSRWQERWLGHDEVPERFGNGNSTILAFLPLIGFVTSLYAAISNQLWPLESSSSTLIFSFLCLLTVLDRYTAKLVTIAFALVFVLYTQTLNLPSILSLALQLSSFFVPQYVGDVLKEFGKRNFKWRGDFLDGLGALGAGVAIFWLYILAESLAFSQGTDASKVTPAAITSALAYLVRSRVFSASIESPSSQSFGVYPVLSLPFLAWLHIGSLAVFYIWTTDPLIAILSSLLLCGGLLSIHLQVKRVKTVPFTLLNRATTQFLIVVVSELAVFFVIHQLPLVTQDRSKLFLVISGMPIIVLAVLRLITSGPDTLDNSEIRDRSSEIKK